MSVLADAGTTAHAALPAHAAHAALTALTVRQAAAADRAALEAMFQRCTPQTIYRRFHGQVKSFPRAYLAEALAGTPPHFAIVAGHGPVVIALASCRLADPAAAAAAGDGVAPRSSGAAELGILIEDTWQRHGLGRELLARLVAHADSLGLAELQAQMLTEQDWIDRAAVAVRGMRVDVRSRGTGGPAAAQTPRRARPPRRSPPSRGADVGRLNLW